jgi:TolA-binding protein
LNEGNWLPMLISGGVGALGALGVAYLNKQGSAANSQASLADTVMTAMNKRLNEVEDELRQMRTELDRERSAHMECRDLKHKMNTELRAKNVRIDELEKRVANLEEGK